MSAAGRSGVSSRGSGAPILTITSISEDGEALVEDTDFESTPRDKLSGLVARISGGDPIRWARGTRIVTASYTHGYSTVPEALVQAATELVAFDFRQSEPGGGRLGRTGSILPSGGEASYYSRDQLWRAQRQRIAGYARAWL